MQRIVGTLAFVGIAMAASGAFGASCAVNPTTPVNAFDDSAISIIFDSFEAAAGDPATCHLQVPANVNTPPDPDTFTVYSAHYEGFVQDGDTAKITVKHDGIVEQSQVVGPKDVGQSYFDHFIGKDGDGNITSDIRLDYAGDLVTDLDTIDYAVAATLSRGAAEASLDQVGRGQVALLTHLQDMTDLLTSGDLAIDGDNWAGVFGGVGSADFGVRGRYNLAEGFSLLGGGSIVDLATTGATASGGMGAIAVRYVDPGAQAFRLYGEAGLEGGALNMSFTRSYTDSTGFHTVTGSGPGFVGALYGTAGVVLNPTPDNEVVLSGTVKESSTMLSGYTESFGPDNFFAADFSGTPGSFTTARLGAKWTAHLTPELDLTAQGAIGTTFQNAGTTAYVIGGGTTTGTPQSTVFVQYGARLGWTPVSNTTLDAFVNGTTGSNIGTHLQVGAGARMTF